MRPAFGPFTLLHNRLAVLIGMVHFVLPYAIFPIYTAMRDIDRRLENAARSMGAGTASVIWHVILPLIVPGIAAAALLVFIVSTGFFITPVILGAPSDMMISNLIDYYVHELINFNNAAALAVLVALLLAPVIILQQRVANGGNTVSASRSLRLSGNALLLIAAAPILLFLLLPSLIIVPMALSKSQMIQFPPEWISLHSFADYLGDRQWVDSTLLSFQVTIVAVLIAAITGGSAAIALYGRSFAGKGLLVGLIMMPIVMPVVVLALGDYLLFAQLHLLGGWVTIAIAHGVLATPYVFISAQTSLTTELNPALGAFCAQPRRPAILRALPRLLAGDPTWLAGRLDARLRCLVRRGGARALPARSGRGHLTGAHFQCHPVRIDAEDRRQCLAFHRTGAPCARLAGARGAQDGTSIVNSAVQPEKLSASSRHTGREVEVRGLWKSYGHEVYVVRDVSFALRRGEFLTLLGPSGSGKTTSLMMVAGFEKPTRGEILVDGHDIAPRPPEQRNFGVVFQGYALFPQKNVLENVEFGLRMKGVPAAARRRRGARHARQGRARRFHRRESRASCPAVNSSAWRWRGLLFSNPTLSCSTSRSARSIASCAKACKTRSRSSRSASASLSCSSRMTRTRQ